MRSSYFHSIFAHLAEQPRFCVTEKIDRLHRIADKKAGTAIARVPVLKQGTEKNEVGARGVLKFVYQQMLNAVFQTYQHIRTLERCMCRNAGLRKVDDILFGEYHPQLRDGMTKDDKNIAYGIPLLVAVGAGRELSHSVKQSEKPVVRDNPLHNCCEARRMARVLSGWDGATFSPRMRFREKQAAQSLPMRSVGKFFRSARLSQ